MARSHQPVRYREDTGFEYRCPTCEQWWPLTLEHWQPANGMARCRACWRAYHAALERGRGHDDAVRAAKREANALRYRLNKAAYQASQRRWRAANRERIAAYNKAYRARRRAELNAAARAYHAQNRDVILFKKRAAHDLARRPDPASDPLTEDQLFAAYGARSA